MKHLAIFLFAFASLAAIAQPAVPADPLFWPPSLSFLQDPTIIVSSKNQCLALGLKQHLYDGTVQNLVVSDRGTYVAFLHFDLAPQAAEDHAAKIPPKILKSSLVVLNTKTKRSTTHPFDSATTFLQPNAVFDSGIVLATIKTANESRLVTVTANGQINVVLNKADDSWPRPYTVRMDPITGQISLEIYWSFEPLDQQRLLLDPQGRLDLDLSSLSKGSEIYYANPESRISLYIQDEDKWFLYDRASGRRTAVPRPELDRDFLNRSDGADFLLCYASDENEHRTFWRLAFEPSPGSDEESSMERHFTDEGIIVGVNLTDAKLTHDNSALFLTDSGGLDMVPLKQVDFSAYEALLKESAKKAAMSKAKQIATAMAIYSADHNDCYPPAEGWGDAVRPFVKSQDLIDGFQYLLNGDDTTKIAEPTTTAMGVVSTPYGEAIVFADTHVEWRDGKAKS